MGIRDELCGRTVGEFVLRERIGEGAFGAVYRCEQPLLGREAVVKVLHGRLRKRPVMIQRFLREARLASRLDHPYAAHVYAFGVEREDRLLWIAMEMVHGTPLDRWLRDRGPLALPELVPFFECIAEVVQTGHERGIVHRDLKPSNVMVVERAGRLLPKLLDFGVAKLLAEAGAPEILDPPSQEVCPEHEDALGSGASFQADLTDQHAYRPVPPLGGDHPPALDRFFARALAKNPLDRPESALELAAALRVAAGLAVDPVDIPRLDRAIHGAWIADAPQPLAEAVAALEGARNLHQSRDAARELFRTIVRYLLGLALAARAQVREARIDPAGDALLRE